MMTPLAEALLRRVGSSKKAVIGMGLQVDAWLAPFPGWGLGSQSLEKPPSPERVAGVWGAGSAFQERIRREPSPLMGCGALCLAERQPASPAARTGEVP
jgi:hypothetical protein